MKRYFLLAMAVVGLLAHTLIADEPKCDKDEAWARAQAAIAVAKAKAKHPKVVALTKPLPYADAVKVAKAEKKPLIVAVGMDCRGLCTELRPLFVTCHEATFEGSPVPRILLLLHDAAGQLFKLQVWDKLPTPADVKAEAVKGQKRLDPHTAMRQELLEAAIVEMFALEFEPCPNCPQGYVCVNGTCQQAPPQPAQQVGYGSTQYYRTLGYHEMPNPPVTTQRFLPAGETRRFGHRFQAFRQRVRSAMGLEPCQGVSMTFAPAVATQAAPKATLPEVVGGPIREHRLMKAFLLKHGAPADDLDKIEAKYGAGSGIWAQLIKVLLDEGLPLLIEWLRSLVA